MTENRDFDDPMFLAESFMKTIQYRYGFCPSEEEAARRKICAIDPPFSEDELRDRLWLHIDQIYGAEYQRAVRYYEKIEDYDNRAKYPTRRKVNQRIVNDVRRALRAILRRDKLL